MLPGTIDLRSRVEGLNGRGFEGLEGIGSRATVYGSRGRGIDRSRVRALKLPN